MSVIQRAVSIFGGVESDWRMIDAAAVHVSVTPSSGRWVDRWTGEITLAQWDYQDDEGEEIYEGDSDEV